MSTWPWQVTRKVQNMLRHTIQPSILITVACCCSCFIPFADGRRIQVAPGAMHVVQAGSSQSIEESLVLVVNSSSSFTNAKRLNDVFVFRPAESFPMYSTRTIYLSGPCPQPISNRFTVCFIVIAPGYAPEYFVPDQSSENKSVEWQLRPITPDQSRTVFDQLRTLINQDSVGYDTLIRWGDISTETHRDSQWDQEGGRKIKLALSMPEQRLVNQYIALSLSKLEAEAK